MTSFQIQYAFHAKKNWNFSAVLKTFVFRMTKQKKKMKMIRIRHEPFQISQFTTRAHNGNLPS